MTKEESLRISSEINISGACVANKGQLINTCKGQESQTGEKLGSSEPIKLEKIYYLGTYVKKNCKNIKIILISDHTISD